ncbi:MAG TPA: hypothetical protein PK852_02505 [Mesotoga prima]|uniref:hypothetical protein n=1 Tax=Mesotoga prima TaxID=1184387 RepID=UPI002C5403FB|nr:hypothetical protein [Mesotoga prima]HPE52966.1 hypothetical protein [Mesotoga prima]
MSKLATLKARFSSKNENIQSATPTADSAAEQRKAAEGSSKFLRNLLFQKQIDESRVAAFINPQFADPALPDQYKGQEVTFGDFLKVRLENTLRPNGTVGVHYPLTSSLSHDQADGLITALKLLPNRSNDGATPRRRQSATPTAPAAQPATPVENSEIASIKADMSALIDIVAALAEGQSQQAQPAEPVEGHAKVAEPAEPVLPTVINLAPGQVVMVNGELRQVSPDGKRLNKTIDKTIV